MENLNPQESTTQKLQLDKINPIEKSRNLTITKRSDLEEIVEAPLLEACRALWDKNIQTLSSSANSKDVDNKASIIIDFDSLSEENKAIALQITKPFTYDGGQAIEFSVPVTKETTVEEIQRHTVQLVDKLKIQPMNWTPRYTFDDMRKIFAGAEVSREDAVKIGYYYDEETKQFFISDECAQKYKNSIEKQLRL